MQTLISFLVGFSFDFWCILAEFRSHVGEILKFFCYWRRPAGDAPPPPFLFWIRPAVASIFCKPIANCCTFMAIFEAKNILLGTLLWAFGVILRVLEPSWRLWARGWGHRRAHGGHWVQFLAIVALGWSRKMTQGSHSGGPNGAKWAQIRFKTLPEICWKIHLNLYAFWVRF